MMTNIQIYSYLYPFLSTYIRFLTMQVATTAEYPKALIRMHRSNSKLYSRKINRKTTFHMYSFANLFFFCAYRSLQRSNIRRRLHGCLELWQQTLRGHVRCWKTIQDPGLRWKERLGSAWGCQSAYGWAHYYKRKSSSSIHGNVKTNVCVYS